MSDRAITISFVMMMSWFGLGMVLGRNPHHSVVTENAMRPVLDDKRVVMVHTTPGDVTLRILSHEEWRKKFYRLQLNPEKYTMSGLTDWDASPCTIYIEEGWSIGLWPHTGEAQWEGDRGETLAHEIAHCLRGAWHDNWNDIYGAEITR